MEQCIKFKKMEEMQNYIPFVCNMIELLDKPSIDSTNKKKLTKLKLLKQMLECNDK